MVGVGKTYFSLIAAAAKESSLSEKKIKLNFTLFYSNRLQL